MRSHAPPPTLLLVDDHTLVRAGLRAVLEREHPPETIAEAGSLAQARATLARARPRLVVLDLSLADGTGLELLPEIRQLSPAPAVLVLSMHADRRYVSDALRAGAQGYLAKENSSEELLLAVRAILSGEAYFSPRIARVVLEELRRTPPLRPTPPAELSSRELEVLRDLADGRTTKEIGARLGLSPKTIEAHRVRLMRKLGLHSLAELARLAVRLVLVEP
jgi:DNA-binding NarL/FixJ family response regulator